MKANTILAAVLLFCSALSQAQPTVSVERDTTFTGRGNRCETLLKMRVSTDTPALMKGIQVKPQAQKGDVVSIGVCRNGEVLKSRRFRSWRKSYGFRLRESVDSSAVYCIFADIAETAAEGGLVSADVGKVRFKRAAVRPGSPAPASREILLRRICLFKPGDYDSKYWRIPAVRQLSDGTILVVNDKRNITESDLPGDIDVVAKYSTDGGRTWSEPVYVADNAGRTDQGYGDPGLVELEDGTVICTFAGGQNFYSSSWENPQHSYFCVSKDHGRTWSEPVDITATIWGPAPANPYCTRYRSSFFTSGNSLILGSGPHKGRILVANVGTTDGTARGLCNHAVYSDDGGATWQVSDLAWEHGDEAKMVQLLDGRILMSVRQRGERGFVISEDDGQTWGEKGHWSEICTNACNGDIIRYNDGILLHTVPNSMKRENVSVFLSFDEGRTWPEHKSICHYQSVYSSITVLQDGTIGAYLEENPHGGCELWYENFSLDWLRNKRK